MLAGQLHGGLGFREAQSFAAVELEEIDSFGNVGVGFSPVLADFKNHPRIELKFALAHDRGSALE